MLAYTAKRTAAAAAIDSTNAIIVAGIIPQTNWGGIETSAPQYAEGGEMFILYRMNCGGADIDKWHRARIQESRKGYFFKAYGLRRYLSEVLRVPQLRIPKRF